MKIINMDFNNVSRNLLGFRLTIGNPLLKNEYYHWVHEAVLAKIKEDEDEQK